MAVFKLLIVSTLLVKVSILASSIEVRVISKSWFSGLSLITCFNSRAIIFQMILPILGLCGSYVTMNTLGHLEFIYMYEEAQALVIPQNVP